MVYIKELLPFLVRGHAVVQMLMPCGVVLRQGSLMCPCGCCTRMAKRPPSGSRWWQACESCQLYLMPVRQSE